MLSNGIKVQAINRGAVRQFIIRYPKKVGKSVSMSKEILTAILKDSDVIIHMDTSLSFSSSGKIQEKTTRLKSILQSMGIGFQYRVDEEGAESQRGILGIPWRGKNSSRREVITFKLSGHQDGLYINDDALQDSIINLGCYVFAPASRDYDPEIVSKVFNRHYEDNDTRYSTFKFVIFLNDVVGQAMLTTRTLNTGDVEKIVEAAMDK